MARSFHGTYQTSLAGSAVNTLEYAQIPSCKTREGSTEEKNKRVLVNAKALYFWSMVDESIVNRLYLS